MSALELSSFLQEVVISTQDPRQLAVIRDTILDDGRSPLPGYSEGRREAHDLTCVVRSEDAHPHLVTAAISHAVSLEDPEMLIGLCDGLQVELAVSRRPHVEVDKAWSTLVAKAALSGYQLWRSAADDGARCYFLGKWGHVRTMASMDEVVQILALAGAK